MQKYVFIFLVFFSCIKESQGANTFQKNKTTLKIAEQFAVYLNSEKLEDAYAMTDKEARIAPAWFSSLENFTEAANVKWLRGGGHFEHKLDRIWKLHLNNNKEYNVSFVFKKGPSERLLEVRLCRKSKNSQWKVCYFQGHAG